MTGTRYESETQMQNGRRQEGGWRCVDPPLSSAANTRISPINMFQYRIGKRKAEIPKKLQKTNQIQQPEYRKQQNNFQIPSLFQALQRLLPLNQFQYPQSPSTHPNP